MAVWDSHKWFEDHDLDHRLKTFGTKHVVGWVARHTKHLKLELPDKFIARGAGCSTATVERAKAELRKLDPPAVRLYTKRTGARNSITRWELIPQNDGSNGTVTDPSKDIVTNVTFDPSQERDNRYSRDIGAPKDAPSKLKFRINCPSGQSDATRSDGREKVSIKMNGCLPVAAAIKCGVCGSDFTPVFDSGVVWTQHLCSMECATLDYKAQTDSRSLNGANGSTGLRPGSSRSLRSGGEGGVG